MAASGTFVKIRPASGEDLPAILRIYNEEVLHGTATYDVEPRTLQDREKWFEDLSAQGYPVLVVEAENGSVAGFGSLSPFNARVGYRFTVMNSLYLDPGHRGRGLGSLLLAELIDAGRVKGYRSIIAWIDADNRASIRLHEKLGFESIGHAKNVGFKFDRWLSVDYYQLLFY